MDLEMILNTLNLSENCGQTLGTEQSVLLYNSLITLQKENHFQKVFYWGRILGLEKDYFVSYGYTKDILLGKTFFYSQNCLDWNLLLNPSEQDKLLAGSCTRKFQGDPSYFYDIIQETRRINLKEEVRLAAIVSLITEEAALVPRGGLFKREDGVVVENLSFEGLTRLQAHDLKWYLHFRKPERNWEDNLMSQNDYNYALDFLDPISLDSIKDSWVLQLNLTETLVFLKNLFWPGMIFFHYLNNRRFGFSYLGDGTKCLDVPFMIN